MLAFEDDRPRCDEDCGHIELVVQRLYGTTGKVTCKWATRDGTALAGSDYKSDSGTLVFEDGQDSQTISIEIIDDTEYELEEHFYVDLFDAVMLVFGFNLNDCCLVLATCIVSDWYDLLTVSLWV